MQKYRYRLLTVNQNRLNSYAKSHLLCAYRPSKANMNPSLKKNGTSILHSDLATYLRRVKGLGIISPHHLVRQQEAQMKELAVPTEEERSQRRKLFRRLPKLTTHGVSSADQSYFSVESPEGRVFIPMIQYQQAVALYTTSSPRRKHPTSHGLYHIRLRHEDVLPSTRLDRYQTQSTTPRFGGRR